MLVIHLNCGRSIETNTSFESVSKEIENTDVGYLRLWRCPSPFSDIPTSTEYEDRELIECVIDKQEIAFIDILE